MSLSFLLIGCVILGGIAGFFAWERHQMCKAEIEGSLRRYHATDIKISLDWFDFDRDTYTYDVEYRDRHGKVHTNRCKVASQPFVADESVYWLNPIDPSA
ncbi:MAG TPA: hypothetical protein VFP26_01950 [Gemmatimonadaceae bacterium]|jgi:hypothetical protein|nr:hypothetical protein [Gemmatimonadaceae bacterium]